MLDGLDAPGRETATVPDAVHLVDDGGLHVAGQQKVGVQRVGGAAFDGPARRHQRLAHHLPPEHAAAAEGAREAAKQVDLQGFEVELVEQVLQAGIHDGAQSGARIWSNARHGTVGSDGDYQWRSPAEPDRGAGHGLSQGLWRLLYRAFHLVAAAGSAGRQAGRRALPPPHGDAGLCLVRRSAPTSGVPQSAPCARHVWPASRCGAAISHHAGTAHCRSPDMITTVNPSSGAPLETYAELDAAALDARLVDPVWRDAVRFGSPQAS